MRSFEQRTRLAVGNVRVTIVDRTEIHKYQRGHGFVVTARKEPIAVVIEDKDGERTLSRSELA